MRNGFACIGVAELGSGSILALPIQKSLPLFSASKNVPISTCFSPVLGEVGYFMEISSCLSFLVATKVIKINFKTLILYYTPLFTICNRGIYGISLSAWAYWDSVVGMD